MATIRSLDVTQYDKLKKVKKDCDDVCAKVYEKSLIYYQDNKAIKSISDLLTVVSQNFLGEILSVKKCAIAHNYNNATDNLTNFVSTIKTDVMYIYSEIYEKVKNASNSVFTEQLDEYTSFATIADEKIARLNSLKDSYDSFKKDYQAIDLPDPSDPSYGGRQRRRAYLAGKLNEIAREFEQLISYLESNLKRLIYILTVSLIETPEEGIPLEVPTL